MCGVLNDLIDVLGNFSVILQQLDFEKFNFLILLGFVRQREKSQKFFDLLALTKFESFKSVKYCSCYEFSKVGTFF